MFVNWKKDTIKQTEVPMTEEISDNEIWFPYTAEEEPITMEECGEIYYANQQDFETIKDYINSLDIKVNEKLDIDDSFFIGLNNSEDMKEHCIDKQIEQSFSNLRESGIKYINRIFDKKFGVVIVFFIDGTSSSRYGVLWRNHNNKFATFEDKLSDEWYSYGYMHY